jgi:DNA-binding transcriptional regulator YiaG
MVMNGIINILSSFGIQDVNLEIKEWQPDELIDFRSKYGLYQRELAELLGVKREYINYVENGKSNLSKTAKILLTLWEFYLQSKEKLLA